MYTNVENGPMPIKWPETSNAPNLYVHQAFRCLALGTSFWNPPLPPRAPTSPIPLLEERRGGGAGCQSVKKS